MKTFKRLLILLLSMAMIGCVAAFAACTDPKDPISDDPYKEESGYIVISVVYPDGKAVNGPEDGRDKYDPETVKNVAVQWCIIDENGDMQACCPNPAKLDANGKVKISAQDITEGINGTQDTKIEFHVLNLIGYQDDGDYGTFVIKNLPTKLDITLKEEAN